MTPPNEREDGREAVDDGGPAFPPHMFIHPGNGEVQSGNDGWGAGGMSLRDYYAIKALPIVFEAARRLADGGGDATSRRDICLAAYAWADEMLAARRPTP